MAARFAGDFFGIALIPEKSEKSSLVKYFPELADVKKSGQSAKESKTGARAFGGAKAVSPFVGFKTFEKVDSKEAKAAPVFAGFKPQSFTG